MFHIKNNNETVSLPTHQGSVTARQLEPLADVVSNHPVCSLSLQPKRRSLRLIDVSTDEPRQSQTICMLFTAFSVLTLMFLSPQRPAPAKAEAKPKPKVGPCPDYTWVDSFIRLSAVEEVTNAVNIFVCRRDLLSLRKPRRWRRPSLRRKHQRPLLRMAKPKRRMR